MWWKRPHKKRPDNWELWQRSRPTPVSDHDKPDLDEADDWYGTPTPNDCECEGDCHD